MGLMHDIRIDDAKRRDRRNTRRAGWVLKAVFGILVLVLVILPIGAAMRHDFDHRHDPKPSTQTVCESLARSTNAQVAQQGLNCLENDGG
jgi:hypothetical protein